MAPGPDKKGFGTKILEMEGMFGPRAEIDDHIEVDILEIISKIFCQVPKFQI